MMKQFMGEKFCNNLRLLRGEQNQNDFASKLNINRSTLSLLETGKQLPSLEVLNTFCEMGGYSIDDYFEKQSNQSIIFLMGSLSENDVESVKKIMEKIKIKEKYEILARRCANASN